VQVLLNVTDVRELDELPPAACDGIGLVRSEFLFGGDRLPDEETQYRAYRRIVDWAQGRPATIRTLDAGGDKPIAGLGPAGEANPALGLRGVRLSLAYPEVLRVQLRALLRAAVHGPLRIMVPMVTVPAELERVRALLEDELAALTAAGVPVRRPPLGMMVEVPAAALTVELFDAAFFSIGSNDLAQYTTAAARDLGGLAELVRPLHPAVLELVGRVVARCSARGREVSLCGDAAADPALVGVLLACGLRALSVAPAALATTKAAVRGVELARP
jgi:phosphotransferase system enzyme I (PtsI)